jgi:hypothetical protein
VPQHEELDVLGGGGAAHQYEQSEHLPEDQVQQSQRHAGIMRNQRSSVVSDPALSSGTPHAPDISVSRSSVAAAAAAGTALWRHPPPVPTRFPHLSVRSALDDPQRDCSFGSADPPNSVWKYW